MHLIETELFQLEMNVMLIDQRISAPANTLVNIKVFSDNFSADGAIHIDYKTMGQFSRQLHHIFETQRGTASISGVRDSKNYIEFQASTDGRIRVRGTLVAKGNSGFTQELNFENGFDRSKFETFVNDVNQAYGMEEEED
jgi:RecB family endonuclease NucS